MYKTNNYKCILTHTSWFDRQPYGYREQFVQNLLVNIPSIEKRHD